MPLKSRRILFVSLFLLALFTLSFPKSSALPPPKITGKYSDMHHIQESGDVFGTEIKIVFTGSSYQGAIQLVEGVPGEPIVVEITASENRVSFSMRKESPCAGRFEGVIEAGYLTDEFRVGSRSDYHDVEATGIDIVPNASFARGMISDCILPRTHPPSKDS